MEVRFTQELAQNGHKWPRGSSGTWPGVPPCLCPGTTTGTGTLLARRRKIRSAGRNLDLGACMSAVATSARCPQVSQWHKEAHFGYWRPGAPWSTLGGMRPGERGSQLGVRRVPLDLFAAAGPGLRFAKSTVVVVFWWGFFCLHASADILGHG